MPRPRILLVEDEPHIAATLSDLLRQEGYDVALATTAEEARAAIRTAPELVLLDWTLPDGQGIDLVTAWRRAGVTAPIIVVTARASLTDRVVGLELGADDYVTKPFEPRELCARIKARLRRVGPAPATLLRHGEVAIDRDAREVTLRGVPVPLTKLELDLLVLLVEGAGRVFTREELLNKVWGFDSTPTTRTVDTHVLQLRQKLGAPLIESVRGVGYRVPR